jgi:hypothetical protein
MFRSEVSACQSLSTLSVAATPCRTRPGVPRWLWVSRAAGMRWSPVRYARFKPCMSCGRPSPSIVMAPGAPARHLPGESTDVCRVSASWDESVFGHASELASEGNPRHASRAAADPVPKSHRDQALHIACGHGRWPSRTIGMAVEGRSRWSLRTRHFGSSCCDTDHARVAIKAVAWAVAYVCAAFLSTPPKRHRDGLARRRGPRRCTIWCTMRCAMSRRCGPWRQRLECTRSTAPASPPPPVFLHPTRWVKENCIGVVVTGQRVKGERAAHAAGSALVTRAGRRGGAHVKKIGGGQERIRAVELTT